jgi:hypothetical protein
MNAPSPGGTTENTMRTPTLFTRLRSAAGALLQRWRTARRERARRLALVRLSAATRRDLGLYASHLDRDDWPASRWTSHHVDRYL